MWEEVEDGEARVSKLGKSGVRQCKKRSISHSLEEGNDFVPKMTANSQTENSCYFFLGTAVFDIRLRK